MSEGQQPDTWVRARDAFLEIVELSPAVREAKLAQLEQDDPELGRWVRRLVAQDAKSDDSPEPRAPTDSFGPYEPVRSIAVGGMGEVYLAKRTDGEFERQVAVKRMLSGSGGGELVERFLRERQTLARLDHKYIARLIDGGTSKAGHPYLVLEYVEGRHIDVYCREEELDVRARVELFAKVCDAVAYAHEHGVIHRDLKPGNVLVRDDGQPRLLDFGIARAVSQDRSADVTLTGDGQRLFTPEFASPEQVRGEPVSEASDIFSLGTILYLLLSDVSPWGEFEWLHDLERKILEQDPVPPSRHRSGSTQRAIVGDLDTIVLACLAKEPAKRPSSVAKLSEELDRHLHHLPITTRPTPFHDRLRRHIRRNPWRFLAGTLTAAALFFGWFALRSESVAEERREELISSFSSRVDSAANLREQGNDTEAIAELEAILEGFESFDAPPSLEARALAELATSLMRVQKRERALAAAERGLEVAPPSSGLRERVQLLNVATNCLSLALLEERALALGREAYDTARDCLEPTDDLRITATATLASITDSSAPDERLAYFAEAERGARARVEPRDMILASILALTGDLLADQNRLEEALTYNSEALDITTWHHGEGYSEVGMLRTSRGNILLRLGRLDEALQELDAALTNLESNDVGTIMGRALRITGMTLKAKGDLEGAVALFEQAREVFGTQAGTDSVLYHEVGLFLGSALIDLGRYEAARETFAPAIAKQRLLDLIGPENEARYVYEYARTLHRLGEEELLAPVRDRAIELCTEIFGPDDVRTKLALELLPQQGATDSSR